MPRSGARGIREEAAPHWVEVGPGVRMRPMVEGSGTAVVFYRIDPGVEFVSHRHEFAELGVVLSGRARISVGSAERDLREGDSFYVPPDVEHGFSVAPGGPPVMLLDISTAGLGSGDARVTPRVLEYAQDTVRPRK